MTDREENIETGTVDEVQDEAVRDNTIETDEDYRANRDKAGATGDDSDGFAIEWT